MSSSFSDDGTHRAYSTLALSQLYTLSSWSKSKSFSGMPYVGFPGLTLTPIPEDPLLDSMMEDEGVEPGEHEKEDKESVETWNPQAMKQGSLPHHWLAIPRADPDSRDVEAAKTSTISSRTCSVDVGSKKNFLPKKDALAAKEHRKSYLTKLLLLTLFSIVVVAGILLWIFSPTFV